MKRDVDVFDKIGDKLKFKSVSHDVRGIKQLNKSIAGCTIKKIEPILYNDSDVDSIIIYVEDPNGNMKVLRVGTDSSVDEINFYCELARF